MNDNDVRTRKMLLTLLPQWNYQIVRPFKQLLEEEITIEMYCCIKELQLGGGVMTMSELGRRTCMPKQQMTKMVNRLVEQQFAERLYDPSDRRIIKIKITANGTGYLNHFLDRDNKCFVSLLEQMSAEDRERFQTALALLTDIFSHMPCPVQAED